MLQMLIFATDLTSCYFFTWLLGDLIGKAYFCHIDGLLAIQRGLYFRSPVSLSKLSFLYTFQKAPYQIPVHKMACLLRPFG